MCNFYLCPFLQGAAPFLVIGTSGTTVLGAFDPLNDIADICERHKLWFHVDVSYQMIHYSVQKPYKALT